VVRAEAPPSVRPVSPPDAVRVCVIDGLSVEGFAEHQLGSRKARLALRMLGIAQGRPVSIERLADVLWLDDQPRDPPAQLAVIMSRLRGVLGGPRISHSDAGYALHADWIDLTAASELQSEADRRLRENEPAPALAAATAARVLLAHPALDDEAWPPEDRRALERLCARARHLVARAALAAGDLGTGVEAAEQSLDEDAYDEESLRLVMAALAAQGRSSSALAMYERMRARLADELGTSPSDQTEAAHVAVLKGLPVPGIIVRSPQSRPRVQRGGLDLPGRADELRVLDDAFLRAQTGTPMAVVIEGEPGIGKTAVASAWIDRLGSQTVVLTARCNQLSRSLPLQPVLHMLRNHLRMVGADVGRELLGNDAALLEPMLDWTSTDGEPVADLTPWETASPAGLAVVFAALRRVVRRACASPAVLFIDDVQRADPLSWAWIAELITSPDLSLLVLLTRRTGEGEVPPQASRLMLSPLSLDAARQIVGDEHAGRLHERSGGNALFLTQLASSDERAAPPESVQAAVLERCAEAGAAARTLMSAAVLGASVDIDVLAAVLRTDPIRLLEDLDVGVRLGLLEARDGVYGFRHAIVREVLDVSTASPRRALLHREAARVLSGAPGSDPLLVAHHARLSGARAIASSALTAASRIAADRFDYETALDLASEAIDADDTSEARVQRAIVQLRLTRFEAAQSDAERAIESAIDSRALEVAGSVAYYCRDFERAATLGEALIQQASEPGQWVQGHVIRARALHAIGDVAGADDLMDRAMAACRKQRLRQPTSVYAFLKVHMGEAGLAISAIEASPHAAVDAVSTIYTPVHAYLAHGYALATCGRGGEALAVLERASAEGRRRGLTRYASLGVNISAWVLRNIGDVSRALECNQAALEGARESVYRELEVYALLDPCDDAIAERDVAAASRAIDTARAIMQDTYAYRWRHELRVDLLEGRIALLQGDPEGALTLAERLIASATDRYAPRYAQLGEVLRLQGCAALEAEPPAAEALAELSSSLSAVAGVEAWWVMAELGVSLGSDVCFELAAAHRDRLAAHLDASARAAFLAYAGTRLESTRTRGRTG
jgi:DNA-binding SARP family transcriptional activator/tetratricopeptide (TPR) repeat protein